jgi:hypothetical protein
MKILLNEKEVIKAIAKFYNIKEEFVSIDEDGFYDLDLPEGSQITVTVFKEGK